MLSVRKGTDGKLYAKQLLKKLSYSYDPKLQITSNALCTVQNKSGEIKLRDSARSNQQASDLDWF